MDELRWQFGSNFDINAQAAYDDLSNSGIIRAVTIGGERFYVLDVEGKYKEIMSIISGEPSSDVSEMIRPDEKEFKGLKEAFRTESDRKWPSRGHYYFCTLEPDPHSWVVPIKARPLQKPYRVKLGSTKDSNSRIMRIWAAVEATSKDRGGGPFVRSWVESVDQKACGNNRHPSRSAFQIFLRLGWLEEAGKKGNVRYYRITKAKQA